MRISKSYGQYDFCSNEKKWLVTMHFPEGSQHKRLSQHWENEPDIDGQWPSDVIEMIAEELEKAWIDTSRRDKRAVIAWARSQVDILDKVWAEREIENITNTIAGLIERREHLEGVVERLAKETNDDQD
ncbi:MAG: hypothetical protein ACPG4T_15175 [Nannocystaceae bacterium]